MSDNQDNEVFEGTPEEQIEKMKSALERYKKENQKFREQRDDFKRQLDEGVANDEQLSKFKSRALKAEAKLKLQELGIKDTDRLTKYINFEGVEVNDNDEVEGLDEKIDALKGDFPELFNPKKRVGGVADAGAGSQEVKKQLSASEIQARQLQGSI